MKRLLHGKTAESSDNDLRSVIRAEDLMGQFTDKDRATSISINSANSRTSLQRFTSARMGRLARMNC